MEVSDLVLLADESFPGGKWPLERVVEVMPSRDELVGTVRVKTSCTVVMCAKGQRNGEPLSGASMLEMDLKVKITLESSMWLTEPDIKLADVTLNSQVKNFRKI